jgi:hypothetical protein
MPARNVRYFALVYGIVFLVVGIAGFFPGLVAPPEEGRQLAVNSGFGLLFDLFPVNVLHNLVHVVFGIWGLAAYRTFSASRAYARAVAVIYAVLTVMGLIPALATTFGFIPIYGHDVWLHAGTALIASYFGWRTENEVERRAGESTDRRQQAVPVEVERRLGHADRRVPGSEV